MAHPIKVSINPTVSYNVVLIAIAKQTNKAKNQIIYKEQTIFAGKKRIIFTICIVAATFKLLHNYSITQH